MNNLHYQNPKSIIYITTILQPHIFFFLENIYIFSLFSIFSFASMYRHRPISNFNLISTPAYADDKAQMLMRLQNTQWNIF